MSQFKVTWTDVLPTAAAETEWQVLSLSGHPLRQAVIASDARWRTRFLNVWDACRLVSTVPVLLPSTTRFGDRHLRELFGGENPAAFCVVGSPIDYVTDIPTAKSFTNERPEILELVCHQARTAAHDAGRTLAAVGVPLDVADTLAKAMGGQRATTDVHFALTTVGPCLADYLQQLSRGRREMVRRDLRKIEEAGLTRSWVEVSAAWRAGCDHLVATVKQRHGVLEPARLVRLRVDRWARSPLGTTRALLVYDGDTLLACSFVRTFDNRYEVYEVGMVDDHPHRLLGYLTACFYGALSDRLGSSTRRLELGVGSGQPKLARGAVAHQLFSAVAAA